MSFESLLALAVFALVSLLQALAKRRNRALEPEVDAEREQQQLEVVSGYPPAVPPAGGLPWQPAPDIERAAPPSSRVVPPRAAPIRTTQQRALALRASPGPRTSIVPRGAAALRRAWLVAAILGPPRALEPYQR
jgi:hypothetical protein